VKSSCALDFQTRILLALRIIFEMQQSHDANSLKLRTLEAQDFSLISVVYL